MQDVDFAAGKVMIHNQRSRGEAHAPRPTKGRKFRPAARCSAILPRMAEIRVTVDDADGAMIDLAGEGGGEIRDSIALDELDDGVPALGSLVLHFDFYGRLAQIEVTDAAGSVLPPSLIDAAEPR